MLHCQIKNKLREVHAAPENGETKSHVVSPHENRPLLAQIITVLTQTVFQIESTFPTSTSTL